MLILIKYAKQGSVYHPPKLQKIPRKRVFGCVQVQISPPQLKVNYEKVFPALHGQKDTGSIKEIFQPFGGGVHT